MLKKNARQVSSNVRNYVKLCTAKGIMKVINKNTYITSILKQDGSSLEHILHSMLEINTHNLDQSLI